MNIVQLWFWLLGTVFGVLQIVVLRRELRKEVQGHPGAGDSAREI